MPETETSPFDRAIALLHGGKLEEGIALLDECCAIPELRHVAMGNKAWTLLSMGRHDEALAIYEAMMAEWPEVAEPHAMRAKALVAAGRPREGLDAAVQCLAKFPESTQAARAVAEAQSALGLTHPDARSERHSARTINPVIAKLEEDVTSFPTSADPRIGLFLYAMVRMAQPRLVFETGTFIAYSTICMAQAIADNGGGHLHTFDLYMDHTRYQSPYLPGSKDAHAIASAHIREAGLSEVVTLHKGCSWENVAAHPSPTGDAACVDLAFVDGDHSIKGCLRDIEAVAAKLKPGGLILLHDTNPEMCDWLGPRYALEEALGDAFQWVNLPTPEGVGVAVMQKKTKENWRAPLPTFKDALWDRFFIGARWPK